MGRETIMLWFGTKLTLHVVSNRINEIKATSYNGEDDVMELWPDHSMFVYAMHKTDGDVLCFVQVLEDGGLDQYQVPASCAHLVLGKNESALLVETRFGNDPDECASLKVLDNAEQAMLFNVMLEAMQICSTDERRVM